MESYLSAVNDMKRDLAEKVATIKNSPEMKEVVRLLPTLNGLEALLNQPRTSLGQLFALEGANETAAPVAALQPDEFVHMAALDAAKKYLRIAGKPARTFKEIVTAIKLHGGDVGREDRLKIQLIRSTADIKKVGDDLFGLLEWYPARRGRPPGSRSTETGASDEGTPVEHQEGTEEENAPPEGEASDESQ